MAGGGGGSDSGEPEFQVAPMIDVLLVILIFFMTITTTQVLKVDKSIKLPLAPDALKKDDARAEAIINVRWDPVAKKPTFLIDERPYVKAEEMIPQLKELKRVGETAIAAGKNPKFRGVIRADRDVPAIHVSQVMLSCASADISDISFASVNKD